MPRTFNEKEKGIIREKLLQKGRELFSEYGLKKTNISELTSAAGIAQGTFYNFFDSKEELYFEIMELEESKSAEFLENQLNSSKSAKESINKLIKGTFQLFEENPFLRRIFDSQDYELMVRKLPEEKLENHQREDTALVLKNIIKMQNKDELIDTPPEVISGLLRAIVMLYYHEEEIGKSIFPEVIDLLANIVSEGLVKEITDKNP